MTWDLERGEEGKKKEKYLKNLGPLIKKLKLKTFCALFLKLFEREKGICCDMLSVGEFSTWRKYVRIEPKERICCSMLSMFSEHDVHDDVDFGECLHCGRRSSCIHYREVTFVFERTGIFLRKSDLGFGKWRGREEERKIFEKSFP